MMTNLIAVTTPEVTISSLELVQFINNQREAGEAELRHDHFMVKVPKVLGEAAPKFLGTSFYVNGAGNKVPRAIYTFPKREACLLAMSYSYDLQAKVFDRMTALEQQAKAFNPAGLTRMDLIKIAMEAESERLVLADTVQSQQATIALQEPKVEALDRIATSDGSMCITNAGKALQCQPKRLFAHMQEGKWIYRRAGGSGFVGYQDKIRQGLLDHKVTTVDRSDGSSKMVEQVLVTAKGLAKLAIELSNRMIITPGATHG
jgi:phage antirepressor YoqD-like protein